MMIYCKRGPVLNDTAKSDRMYIDTINREEDALARLIDLEIFFQNLKEKNCERKM